MWIWSLGQEDLLDASMATHFSILAWKCHGQRSLEGYSPWGCKDWKRLKRLSMHAAATAKSLQSCPTLCNPIDGSPPGSLSPGLSRQEHWSGLPFPSPVHGSEKWKWSRSVVSDSSRPHGLQPTRLLHPRDFPGKSTGVGCHCMHSQSSDMKISLWVTLYFMETSLLLYRYQAFRGCPELCFTFLWSCFIPIWSFFTWYFYNSLQFSGFLFDSGTPNYGCLMQKKTANI